MSKLVLLLVSIISTSALAENVVFKLNGKNLKIAGLVSSQANKPVVISGFDLAGAPYRLEIGRTTKPKNSLQFDYVLERNGTKESGSILTAKGQPARFENKTDDKNSSDLSFEATVSE